MDMVTVDCARWHHGMRQVYTCYSLRIYGYLVRAVVLGLSGCLGHAVTPSMTKRADEASDERGEGEWLCG